MTLHVCMHLTVLCKPVGNSRFFGPYVIEKKLDYFKYIIVTPDGRKQTVISLKLC